MEGDRVAPASAPMHSQTISPWNQEVAPGTCISPLQTLETLVDPAGAAQYPWTPYTCPCAARYYTCVSLRSGSRGSHSDARSLPDMVHTWDITGLNGTLDRSEVVIMMLDGTKQPSEMVATLFRGLLHKCRLNAPSHVTDFLGDAWHVTNIGGSKRFPWLVGNYWSG